MNPPVADKYGLAPRMVDALTHYAAGKTVMEIGDIMDISPNTVDCHIERVKQVLGIPSRHGLVHFAIWAGYVEARDMRR